MNGDEKNWREEREKVLEEWSEIELKFRSGTPVRIELARDSVTSEDPIEQETVISEQPRVWGENKTEDGLVQRLLHDDYDLEKAGVLALLSEPDANMNSLVLRCICRPVETLHSETLFDEKVLLIALSRKSYSGKSAIHWQMLLEFYRTTAAHALDDSSLANECPQLGAHWQIVGFQGTNPSTDFRGVGVLGLLQLYSLVHTMQEDTLKTIIKMSRNEPKDFPFAVVGINFTSLLLSKLKTQELNGMVNSMGGFLPTMNALYRGCFVHFCRHWKDNSCTIRDFQHVLNEVSTALSKDPWKLMKPYPIL